MKPALTKAEHDALVAKLGRPITWPPIGRRQKGHGPDTSTPDTTTKEEGK